MIVGFWGSQSLTNMVTELKAPDSNFPQANTHEPKEGQQTTWFQTGFTSVFSKNTHSRASALYIQNYNLWGRIQEYVIVKIFPDDAGTVSPAMVPKLTIGPTDQLK